MAILSIQSHVVYGYAGNTAAVFPMQKLGREVWAVNTVEFSNHTGYGAWRGKVLGGGLVGELLTGLEERGVLGRCEAVLSGYAGDAAVANAVAEAVRKVRAASPKAVYCCDPVMGDDGAGIYVSAGIPAVLRESLVPMADIVTPNRFELELLTGIDIKTLNDARRAVELLHGMGPGTVLVTSYSEGDWIGMLASDKSGLYMTKTPRLPVAGDFGGSGDLTAAVFLSRYLETGSVEKSLELCTASVFGILEASWKAFSGKTDSKELRIIEAQAELDRPSHFFKACRV